MPSESIWIVGVTRSGKTTRLIEQLCGWIQQTDRPPHPNFAKLPKPLRTHQSAPATLVLAANGENRMALSDRLDATLHGQYRLHSTTALGFFLDEVILYWPLLVEQLNLPAQFPLRLRPETEQELATTLWRSALDAGPLRQEGVKELRMVRRTLDLLQLAAAAGIPSEEIPALLSQGLEGGSPELWDGMGEAIGQWRDWCLERGFLTYGIVCELYWRHLLPHGTYQQHLKGRYGAVLADDVDEYPTIARHLFDRFLDWEIPCAFTYNPDGAVRLGLNADPHNLAQLAQQCVVEELNHPGGLAATLGLEVVQLALDPTFLTQLGDGVESLQTASRSQLLRQTGEAIAKAVKSDGVQPHEIAVIAPGMDAIARYTLSEILSTQGIATQSLNLQRPLIGSATIRALLTLLALVYPGLGRLIDRDAIAEMLVILSRRGSRNRDQDDPPSNLNASIDPVRAGSISDYCYLPHPEQPRLLGVTEFPRWDRLGYRATNGYNEILDWIEKTQLQLQQGRIPNPVSVLDRAIAQFLWHRGDLPYDQLAALRELLETAGHYWEVATRVQERHRPNPTTTLKQFIQLLRRGTVTANPYPLRPLTPRNAVTLANIFQYRASRQSHRWHFWLDVASPFWSSGGAAVLFGAPLFLQDWSGRPLTADDTTEADEERLRRILLDLLGRASHRVILCHSDLAANGQEQMGPLLSLVNASVAYGGQLTVDS